MDLQTLDRAATGGPSAGGDDAAPVGLRQRLTTARAQWALAALILLGLVALAWHFDVKPRHEALSALPDTLRTLGAVLVVFGVGGFGIVRLLLPAPLRRYELLWVLPVGACAVGLTMTVLGFAGLPYPASLAAVLAAGIGLWAYGVRRRGWPRLSPSALAWPVYLALVVTAIALVVMVFRQHYAAPIGTGSDAHVATGVAQFLKHAYPTSVDVSQPINQMQPLWKSKYPIYYAFAAVSSVSGLATWQVLPILAAAMLGLAALGMFLVARDVFKAPAAIAAAAMAFAALDREALHTILNPYFNQTWGFFALPFTLVTGWLVVQPGIDRRARQATALLLLMFALVLVFAYPLAAPIPAVPIIVFAWSERRRRIAAGERLFRVRDLYRGRWSLAWIVPLCALLAIPAAAAVQKGADAADVLLPGHSLQTWAGDLPGFVPWGYFFSLPSSWLGWVLLPPLLYLVYLGLARQPRSLALGLGGLMVVGLVIAAYLRHRAFGWYFEFKLLAFIGPVLLLIAALGAGRLRRVGPPLLAALALTTAVSTVWELNRTGSQLPTATIELSSWADSLPKGASIRLDMWPPLQLWAGYFLASRPLCSQLPLLGTDYPHVPISRKADYILTGPNMPKPRDATGPPVRANEAYTLYRESPATPGVSTCSQRRLDRIYTGAGWSPY